ncbi:MAG: hypothetical protein JHD15_00340 [Phenylobacterium sp.]|uniref:hypothetical protein n=1 Tax=Phenylobacterium sp. TaxID=1871053 RepID=UPI001A20AB47|nr:hypothetical protein [Phenylobacterium sp.]MBJ7408805.1 hypothetical protein [Phenylobacterium sp.]
MSITLSAVLWLLLAGAPVCPASHSRAECDAIWAATHAVAATQDRGADRAVSAGAAAYLASSGREPPTVLPPALRMRFLYQVTDLLSLQARTTVVLKRAVYYVGDGGLICGTGLFGDRMRTFYSNDEGIRLGATATEMEAAGCSRGGGVLLAAY